MSPVVGRWSSTLRCPIRVFRLRFSKSAGSPGLPTRGVGELMSLRTVFRSSLLVRKFLIVGKFSQSWLLLAVLLTTKTRCRLTFLRNPFLTLSFLETRPWVSVRTRIVIVIIFLKTLNLIVIVRWVLRGRRSLWRRGQTLTRKLSFGIVRLLLILFFR